jgi:hypothetical protein
MTSRRHLLFNLALIIIPWLSIIFIGKRTIKRYLLASVLITVFEMINHIYGYHRKWWKFYDKPKSFIRDELPFDIGPYIPISMWILKMTYGNIKMFAILNAIVNAFFAFLFIPFLKKVKIVRLNRINHFQFFIILHYKAYILYAIQYLIEKKRYHGPALNNN